MNQLCAYCQSPLAPGERQCQRCGRWQSLSNTAYHPSEDPADDAWEDTNSTWANPSGPTQQGRLSRGQPLGSPQRRASQPIFCLQRAATAPPHSRAQNRGGSAGGGAGGPGGRGRRRRAGARGQRFPRKARGSGRANRHRCARLANGNHWSTDAHNDAHARRTHPNARLQWRPLHQRWRPGTHVQWRSHCSTLV